MSAALLRVRAIESAHWPSAARMKGSAMAARRYLRVASLASYEYTMPDTRNGMPAEFRGGGGHRTQTNKPHKSL
jgi:hypothetical protein